jgi:hypothetical protein
VLEAKMVLFNERTPDNLNNPNALKVTIASSKFNFLLLPQPNKTLQLVHNIMLVPQGLGQDPLMICTQGNQSMSPFQVIPHELIMTAIQNRRGTMKSDARWIIPTLKQFLDTNSGEEFEALQVEEGTEIKEDLDFTNIPQNLFTHSLIFFTMEKKGSWAAKTSGAKIIKRLQGLQAGTTPDEA